MAHTDYTSKENFCIEFNIDCMKEYGWTAIPVFGEDDETEVDWSTVKDAEEALLLILAHEAMHANHIARFYDAVKATGEKPIETARYLREAKYSDDFIKIFIDEESGEYIKKF